MLTTILILKIMALSFVITQFTPLQWIIDCLPENMFKWIISTITTCISCTSFWTGLFMGGIWIACSCYIISTVYKKYLSKYLEDQKFI